MNAASNALSWTSQWHCFPQQFVEVWLTARGTPRPHARALVWLCTWVSNGMEAGIGATPEPEPEPEEDERGCVEKGTAMAIEYKETLSVLPLHWKVIWAVVLLLWVPIAYTVAAPIPGSMLLFLIAWTSFVLRHAGTAPQRPDVEADVEAAQPDRAVESPQQYGGFENRNRGDVFTTRRGVVVTVGPPLPSMVSPFDDPRASEIEQPAWFQPIANPLFQQQGGQVEAI